MTKTRLYELTKGSKTKVAVLVLVILAGSQTLGILDNETIRIASLIADALLGYGIYDKLQRNMKK